MNNILSDSLLLRLNRKNSILLVTSIFPPQPGGPAIFTARFSRWLSKSNLCHKVITYAVTPDDGVSEIDVIKISLNKNRLLAFFKMIFLIIVNSNKQTTILSNGAFIETYLASKIAKRRYIIKLPGDQLWEFSKNKKWTNKNIEQFQFENLNFFQTILRYFFNLAYKNAEFLITPSNQLSKFARNWGVDAKKIKRINNSVNPNSFKVLTKAKKKYDVITVCRLVPWKGLEELVTTCIKMRLTLAIVGSGPLKKDLEILASHKNDKILLLGDFSNLEIVDLLNSSKIFVLNSEYEATSYALIEAKMSGMPTIARKTDGSCTVIRNNIDGFLYSGKPGDNLSTALDKILSNKIKMKDFGARAREDALLRFNEEINFKKIFQLMEKCE